jgi:SAM-dependent methyltransferase
VLALAAFALLAAVTLLAAGREFLPYSSAKPILDAQRDLPDALRSADEAKWGAWAQQEDKTIRARLEQGDLDSMVNLLLYGASFTRQPRIKMESLTEASKSGVLRARVDDLVAGLRRPGDNQRLQFLQGLVRSQGADPEAADGARQTGEFLYKNLLRVLEERKALAARAAKADSVARPDDPASLLDRASLFDDRGLSLDTGIFPDFTIEQTLRDLKKRGVLGEGRVARVAVIGPGLDFIDKNEDAAFDYYPEQTVQPFALYDSLARLGLATAGGVSISVLDISSRVIEHLQRARERARTGAGYVIQLPRDVARPWPPDVIGYWNSMGDRIGTAIAPIKPPEIFAGLPTRAVRIRPAVVLACEPVDLDIVLQRLDLAAADRFDLIVATNIFVYYDAFEQSLALANTAAMLKPGGLLLTNDRLPVIPQGSMRLAGVTEVPFDASGVSAREAVGWYRKDERPGTR